MLMVHNGGGWTPLSPLMSTADNSSGLAFPSHCCLYGCSRTLRTRPLLRFSRVVGRIHQCLREDKALPFNKKKEGVMQDEKVVRAPLFDEPAHLSGLAGWLWDISPMHCLAFSGLWYGSQGWRMRGGDCYPASSSSGSLPESGKMSSTPRVIPPEVGERVWLLKRQSKLLGA